MLFRSQKSKNETPAAQPKATPVTHIAPMPDAVAQASPPTMVVQQTADLPASAATGATTPSNGLQPPLPMPAPQGAPMPPQGTVSGPGRPPGILRPGGAILSSTGSIHAFSDDGTGGDCCTTCRPSILERIKGIFQRNPCPPGYCPAAYTPDNGSYPAEISCGQKIAPTPPRAPHQLFTELFQHSKPVGGADTSTSNEIGRAHV